MTQQEIDALDYFLGWKNLSPIKLIERLNDIGFALTPDDTLRTILDAIVKKYNECHES